MCKRSFFLSKTLCQFEFGYEAKGIHYLLNAGIRWLCNAYVIAKEFQGFHCFLS
jgi:hypothetical protein